jgi:bifunctional non-homologous end joining protein LigD
LHSAATGQGRQAQCHRRCRTLRAGLWAVFLAVAVVATYLRHVPRIAFIPVACPKLRPSPPSGPEWLHEFKFDGFRLQLHKLGKDVRLFSRNGKDFTDRFPSVSAATAVLPAASAIIDAEIVAYDETGKPDFYTLLRRRASGVCVWCFDLLGLDAEDLRPLPLEKRKESLAVRLSRAGDDRLKMSESFDDGLKLLEAAARMNLEGIVCKKRGSPYVAGVGCGWIKGKTPEWREANRERYKLFEKV